MTTGHMHVTTEHGEPHPKEHICINTAASMAQGTSRKREWEDCKSQDTRNSAVKSSHLEMAA